MVINKLFSMLFLGSCTVASGVCAMEQPTPSIDAHVLAPGQESATAVAEPETQIVIDARGTALVPVTHQELPIILRQQFRSKKEARTALFNYFTERQHQQHQRAHYFSIGAGFATYGLYKLLLCRRHWLPANLLALTGGILTTLLSYNGLVGRDNQKSAYTSSSSRSSKT
jgi:hypothetical protein